MATATTSKTTTAKTSQPATGLGSLAMTNSLLASGAKLLSGSSAPTTSSGGRDELPAGVAYQTYNTDGTVRSSETYAQKSAQEASDISSGKDTPFGVGGEITGAQATNPVSSAPIQPPTTPTNTPVSTTQPSPSTVDATPYTSTSSPAGSTPSAATQAHAAALASGAAAPQNAGVGVSAATTAMNNANTGYTPTAPVVQAYTDATKKLTDDYAKAMSSQDQGKSLVSQYQDFTKQLGIPALNTQLMNMKNVIDGTEDDIRNEVTKAGGFATDSQVLAMTNARNKTMIQNYNNLLQTRSDAMQQVQTLVGLSAQDRDYAEKQIDRQLNFDQQQVTFADKALANAQSSIQKSIDTYGAASVLKQALATGDPTAVSRINATMGNGFDLHTAALHPTLDQQYKQAEIAKIYSDINSTNSGGSDLALANLRKTASGISYIDGTNLTGKDATAAQKAAAQAGVPFLDKTSADLQNNIETARQNLSDIQGYTQGVLPSGTGSGFNYLQRLGNAFTGATQIGTNAANLGSFGTARSAAIEALRAVAGAKGLRINQAEIQAAQKYDIPNVTDTQEVANAKITKMNALLDSQEKALFGSQYYKPDTGASNTQSAPQPVLTPDQIPAGMYQASDGYLYKK